jgi:hypothetical protein
MPAAVAVLPDRGAQALDLIHQLFARQVVQVFIHMH